MDINRRENESLIDYCERILDAKEQKLIDIDKSEIWELFFNEKLSSDESRKRLYGVEQIIKKLKSENYCTITEEDVLRELQIKTEELKKERIKLETVNVDYNRRLREQARADLFEERLLERVLQRKEINVPTYKIQNIYSENEMILCLADAHYGADFQIRGMFDEILNEYNPKIFEKRMWDILSDTIKYAEKNNFNKVNIIDLDDSIEGLLHISQLSSLKYGVIDSLINYADFMEIWINELSKYLFVDFSRVKGNHNDLRLLTGKKGDFPHENTSKVITHIIQKGLRNNSNVLITGHNSVGCIYKKIAGFDILASHGQDEKGNLEQSFKDYMLMYKINVDYFCTGHLHSTNIKEIGINKEIIQSPSIVGINDFSTGIKKSANAGAKIVVLTENYGRVDEHNIILK